MFRRGNIVIRIDGYAYWTILSLKRLSAPPQASFTAVRYRKCSVQLRCDDLSAVNSFKLVAGVILVLKVWINLCIACTKV